MSSPFKVGDRVQLISDCSHHSLDDVQTGDLAIVHKVYEDAGCMTVRFERVTINHQKWTHRHGGTWAFIQFKHVTPQFTPDIVFDNVDDAIVAAQILSAHFKRDVPVKKI